MRTWLTRKRVIWLSITTVVAFLLVDGFGSKPAHDVRTPGATPLKAAVGTTDIRNFFFPVLSSQSISDLLCQAWGRTYPNTSCPADLSSTYHASVTQAPNTLYVLWVGCIDWHGAGEIIKWQGYNLEYVPSERKLVIHCYVAEPWITHHPTMFGTVGLAPQTLLVVPTSSIAPGTIQIVEDDRLEHLVGDQSTESTLGTATIDQYAPTGPLANP
jgi:hypothetical protein